MTMTTGTRTNNFPFGRICWFPRSRSALIDICLTCCMRACICSSNNLRTLWRGKQRLASKWQHNVRSAWMQQWQLCICSYRYQTTIVKREFDTFRECCMWLQFIRNCVCSAVQSASFAFSIQLLSKSCRVIKTRPKLSTYARKQNKKGI